MVPGTACACSGFVGVRGSAAAAVAASAASLAEDERLFRRLSLVAAVRVSLGEERGRERGGGDGKEDEGRARPAAASEHGQRVKGEKGGGDRQTGEQGGRQGRGGGRGAR